MRPERQLASEGAIPNGIALLRLVHTEKDTGGGAPEEQAINPGVKGQSPLKGFRVDRWGMGIPRLLRTCSTAWATAWPVATDTGHYCSNRTSHRHPSWHR